MQNTTKREAAFKQISLAVSFLNEVNDSANLAGRSAAKELEHSFRIAQALEHVLPSRSLNALKTGQLPAREMLLGLITLLDNPAVNDSLERVKTENPVRVSLNPENPNEYIRRNADGSEEVGVFDVAKGGFTPNQPKTKKDSASYASHKKKPVSENQGDSTKRSSRRVDRELATT